MMAASPARAKSERHVLAGTKVKRRSMAESPAVAASAAGRRIIQPVLVTGVKVADTVTIFQPKDFIKLNVDETYQRLRVELSVNQLITVLQSGGEIADPIDVARRRDGSLWIVDGQQRFHAHAAVGKPMRAHVHDVDSIDAEAKLFVALNSRRRLTPRTLIKGWPGPMGEFIRKMNTSEKSPLRGMIDLTANNSKLPVDAVTLLKGLLSVMTGSTQSFGEIATRALPRADAALREPGMQAWAENFCMLVAAVFGGSTNYGRVRVLPMIALGVVAHQKYVTAGRPVFPKSTTRLRKTNWNAFVPSHAQQYLGILVNEMGKRWK